MSGCKSRPPRLTPEQIHAITRELSAAASPVLPRGSDIYTHFRSADGGRETADSLEIGIVAGQDQQTQRKVQTALLQSFSAVATRHRLIQEDTGSHEGLAFYYLHAGAATHLIHIYSASLHVAQGKSTPRLAIIVDDLGSDPQAADAIFALPYPLTVSVLPNHEHSVAIAEAAHRRGDEVMLHLPMQSVGQETAEPSELRPGMSPRDVSSIVAPLLRSVPYIAGVNNHQGSRATADTALMHSLMPLLRARHLFYIDSRTTAATVAYDAAQDSGVRCAFRNVPFLDDVQDESAIRKQIELAFRDAQKNGEAVAICHPHATTLKALQLELPRATAQGIRLVPASELVH